MLGIFTAVRGRYSDAPGSCLLDRLDKACYLFKTLELLHKGMSKIRSEKSIVIILTVSLLISFLAGSHGLVLCCGPDDHMQIEATFNGIDCGHFPPSPVQEGTSHYLSTAFPFAATPCFACTDIPLGSPHYLLQKKNVTSITHNKKMLSTAAALLCAMHSLPPHAQVTGHPSLLADHHHHTISHLLSTVLRI